MENTFYSESERKGNFYFKREIKEEKHSLIPIAGNAIITWVGGNGRFKFELNDIEFTSEFPGTNVCKCNDTYFDYSLVTFDINIEKEWSKLYIMHESKDYWKEVPKTLPTKSEDNCIAQMH